MARCGSQSSLLSDGRVRAICNRLTKWYGTAHRRLPWRETRDPYAIWVSEVMLQQTRVEKVLPYYARFLMRFPDLTSLASVPLEEVLKSWEGLGYYARARNLHKASRKLQALDAWPATAAELQTLPGIGRSTAGAIASIAFGEPAPILDGNVKRVWARLTAFGRPPVRAALASLWRLSEKAALSGGDPCAVNQALMELGATLCKKKRPDCLHCPLKRLCKAHGLGREESFPVPVTRRPRKHLQASVAVLWRGGAFLVQKRPEEGFLGGLWELPGGKWEAGEDGESALRRELREETGSEIVVLRTHRPVRHSYTHFQVTLHPYECRISGKSWPKPQAHHRWIRPEQVSSLPFPTGTQKVFDEVLSHRAKVAECPATYASRKKPRRKKREA
jgi:A/G-specific adenine glycosylase